MNKDTMTKLYKNLPSKDLAALAFHYSLECNELEIARIVSNVEKKDYRCLDATFLKWADKLSSVAGIWGMKYWRLQTARAGVLGVLAHSLGKDGLERIESDTEALREVEAKIIALENVLVSLHETHGISPDDVRRYADTNVFTPSLENIEADLNYQKETLDAFVSLINA